MQFVISLPQKKTKKPFHALFLHFIKLEKTCFLSSLLQYWDENVRKDMAQIASDEVGINSFKMFMAYKDVMMLRDNEMIEVFKTCKEIGAIGQVHAENGDVIEENQV